MAVLRTACESRWDPVSSLVALVAALPALLSPDTGAAFALWPGTVIRLRRGVRS